MDRDYLIVRYTLQHRDVQTTTHEPHPALRASLPDVRAVFLTDVCDRNIIVLEALQAVCK